MANSISLVKVFLAAIDAVYKRASVTARLDGQTQTPVKFDGTGIIEIAKISAVGLGNYSRSGGYPNGDVTAVWEELQLAVERGRKFTVDRADNDESLGILLGRLIDEWMRTQVTPEIDAYRLAKYAGVSGILTGTPGTLSTPQAVLDAVDAASLAMDEAEVPEEGRVLFISSTCNRLLRAAITRILQNEGSADRRLTRLDEIDIQPVPQSRLKTSIDLDPGATSSAGGFTPSAGAKDINFELIHRDAVVQAVKLNQVKYFSPDVNQQSDGHLWQYRLYHDAFGLENKAKGIYLHRKA